MATKKTYKVLKAFEFKDDTYEIDSLVEFTDKQAEKLLELELIAEPIQGEDSQESKDNVAEDSNPEITSSYKGVKIVGVEDVMIKDNIYKRITLLNGTSYTLSLAEFNSEVTIG